MSVTACIVQARMGSTRLPGKVMRPLAGTSVLHHVLRRCQAIPGVDLTVCATVNGPDGDAVAAEAAGLGVTVFRGSEHDVLERYHRAAGAVGADVIVRVTSDCPLIDPEVCGRVLAARDAAQADHATNNFEITYPHGLDCECFTRSALEHAAELASEPYDREHVTPWIRRHPGLVKANVHGPGGDVTGWRWTLDYPEDLNFFDALFRWLPPPPAIPPWTEAAAVCRDHPELLEINAHRHAR